MTCPQCQKELPENIEGHRCPFCGSEFSGNPVPVLQPQPSGQFQFNWQLFLLAMLLPSAVTQIAALISGRATGPLIDGPAEGVCVAVGVVSGVIGGIICGVMIAVNSGLTLPGKIVLSILLSGMMIVVCLALCCFGCAVGYGGSKL